MKRVLLTGASGLLGSNICYVLKNKFALTAVFHQNFIKSSGFDVFKLDITKEEECKKFIEKFNPDIIIHCAAVTDLDLCESNKRYAFDVNTGGTKNLLKFVDKHTHFIFISTDNVYGGKNKFSDENTKLNPLNVYAESKKKAEHIVFNSGLNYSILRTTIFGWHRYRIDSSLLSFIYQNLKSGKKVNLFEDVFFTPISIPLFIEVIDSIIRNKTFGLFNVCGRERMSKLEFGFLVAEVFKLDRGLINSISITTDLVFCPLNWASSCSTMILAAAFVFCLMVVNEG